MKKKTLRKRMSKSKVVALIGLMAMMMKIETGLVEG
jgi:hypothetical protein